MGPKRRDLLARIIADFTKAIFAVAVASQLFRDFDPKLKALLGVMIVVGIVAALIIQPEDKDKNND